MAKNGLNIGLGNTKNAVCCCFLGLISTVYKSSFVEPLLTSSATVLNESKHFLKNHNTKCEIRQNAEKNLRV